ncbi:hypothetical protein PIB30_034842 [Stylosanthes scabra]|uniref:PB1-like domain-containing protein n=1 Tax=Stylosanthes scabra TaxID=79078 RepID=A0ABU6XBR3_9FABA|nr:hypothetical protein [Stylosanthes scabra]
MDDIFVEPMFNVGGWLVRNDDGLLVYDGGTTEWLEKIEVKSVNFNVLVKMLEGLGYKSYKVMHWYDFLDEHLETGLHRIYGDAEFYIYAEHDVNVPRIAGAGESIAEPVVLDDVKGSSTSTDNGGYESAEDELYKPPAAVDDDETDSDVEGRARAKKARRGKRGPIVTGKSKSANANPTEKGKGVLNRKKESRMGREKVAKKCGGSNIGPKKKDT